MFSNINTNSTAPENAETNNVVGINFEQAESENDCLNQALSFAEKGWRLLTLRNNEKVPSMMNWTERATNDLDRIQGWWDIKPVQGYGILTGKDSCIVLDVDVKNGQPGLASLRKLFSEEELAGFVIVETPSGGLHLYFKSEQEIRNAQGFMPGLDIRGDGGFIVGPGTEIDGKAYRHIQGSFDNLPEFPEKLIKAIQTGKREQRENVQRMLEVGAEGIIGEGLRNGTLFQMACKLRDEFRSEEKTLEKIEKINEERCDPPLDEDELENIVASAFRHEPDLIKFLEKFPETEKGLSDIFLHFYEEDMIYVPEFKKLAFWDGYLWSFDESLKSEAIVKFITKLYQDAVEIAKDKISEAKRNGNEAQESYWKGKLSSYSCSEKKSGSRAGMKNIVDLAKSEIVVNQCELDKDIFKFAVRNGVVDLITGQFLSQPAKGDYMTMQGQVEYDSKATCPRWLAFLNTCTQGDQELQNYLKRIVGYTLTGSTSEQVFFFLYGFGANGKSTFMNVIQRLVGDYHRSIPSSALMVKKQGGCGPSPELAMLRGKRLVVASELEEGERLSESLTKTLTGGDVIPARHLYGEYFEFLPNFKLFMIGNHRPHIMGGDHGIWRRIRLIPFNHTVPESERDSNLEQKLLEELPGILNWAIEGCLEWQEQGLGFPKAVKAETDEYRDSEDIIKRFFSDCCNFDPNSGQLQKDLYEAYKRWALDCNEWAMSNRNFGNKLKEQKLVLKKHKQGNFFYGIKLGKFEVSDEGHYIEGHDEGKSYTI